MCSFYRTAIMYLTRHLPFANELFYDLAVLHPLMLKEDQADLSGYTLNCKETIAYNQTGLCRPTNWWMEDIPRAGDSRGLVHHWTSKRWIQHILKSLPLLKRSVRDAKLNRLTTLLCTTTACEGLLCITHGNAEVENSNVLTSERSLLCDDSINVIKLTKDVIWVRDQDMPTHATEG